MDNIFLTSDTHFCHKNLYTLHGRPKDYEERIEKGFKSLSRSDILIHLGDICRGKEAEMHKRYIKPLKCKKWLVRGNHDNKPNSWYLSHGWDFVCYKFQDKFYGKTVLFTHIPQFKTKNIVELFYGAGNPDINIHGHFHDSMHRVREMRHPYQKTFHRLLALEHVDYKPVKLKTLIKETCVEIKNKTHYLFPKKKRLISILSGG